MTWDFAAQLARHGPASTGGAVSRADAAAYCRRVATAHYENFTVASLMLPRRLLRHFHAVYAYCRWADDLGDETGADAPALLAWWRRQLEACYDGEARHPVFVALRDTIRTFSIPQRPFLDLLAAFEQDQRVTRYATFADLLGYCANSANPVGRLVLYLCRCHDEERGALSDSVCTALQLANFWQDVPRDLDLGRVYLPAEDRLRFGVADAELHAKKFTPAFGELLRFEVERTREMFMSGYPLVGLVPDDVQIDIELIIQGGLAILDKLERAGFDVLTARPALTKWEKGVLLARVAWGRLRRRLRVG